MAGVLANPSRHRDRERPQRTSTSYVGLLGLRLVSATVNFDDPETYHLYYGE